METIVYRVYADGREFGKDYPSLEEAKAARDKFATHFPVVRYRVRKYLTRSANAT